MRWHQLAWACLLLASPALADRLETFELHHRGAGELAASLRPLLGEGETLVAHDNLLILRGSEATIEQVGRLLQRLDRPLARLRISVRRVDQRQAQRRAAGIDGRLDTASPGNSELHGHLHDNLRTEERDRIQQVSVLEGGTAFISVGQDLPYPVIGAGPAGWYAGTQFRETRNGFRVRPRLQGDEVVLEVAGMGERPSSSRGGAIDRSRIVTVVRGRLGEWIPLGGGSSDSRERQRGLLSTAQRGETAGGHIEIRVEREE